MLDLKRIRQEPDAVREALARRGEALAGVVGRVVELDVSRRALIPELEELRARRNAAAEVIAVAKRAGEDAAAAIAEQRELGTREKQFARELGVVEEELQAVLASLPNLPDPTAAPGPEDELVREVGEIPAFAFEPRDHLELAGDAIDMDRAARLSGSRFAYLKGELVMLELALVHWALEKLRAHGFEPVIPPVLVRERALFGTGFLPDTEQQIYRLGEDDLYLVGTSEVALASLARRRDPGRRAAAAALCGLLALLPPRGRRGGEGHAGHLQGAPVRQGRDVQLRRPRGVLRGA